MTRTCGADIGQRGAWAHALVALVALGLAACTVKVGPREPEAREIASLGVAGGEVFVNGERARNGQAIREGDEVSTGPASSAWIQLHDGGYFQLDEETDPIYLFKRIGTAWCLLMRMVRGQAYADRKAACVETPNGSGEAASAFNVSVSPDGGSTEIAVFEGHVTFTSEGQRREIVAGELGRFRRDAPPEVGRALLPEAQLKLVRWRERYHFDAWCCLPSGEVEAVQPALCQERGELFFDRLDALRRCSSAAPTPSPSPGPSPSPTPGAVEIAFSAAPEAIDRGEEARLCYAIDRRSRARIEPGVGSIFRSVLLNAEVAPDTLELPPSTLPHRVLVRGSVVLEEGICKVDPEDESSDCTASAVVLAERIRLPEEEGTTVLGPYFYSQATFGEGDFVVPVNPGVYLVTALPLVGSQGGPAKIQILDLREDSPLVDVRSGIPYADLDDPLVLEQGQLVTVELDGFSSNTTVIPLDMASWADLSFEGMAIDLGAQATCYRTAGDPPACQIRRLRPGSTTLRPSQEQFVKFITRD
ncbi:MAG: hypothetical protein KC420_00595 [Myxococcales bacterium]|nr:hypothetical protein [Myxococcales bacterium]